eukprot:1714157-Amphidinium_carterae.1
MALCCLCRPCASHHWAAALQLLLVGQHLEADEAVDISFTSPSNRLQGSLTVMALQVYVVSFCQDFAT